MTKHTRARAAQTVAAASAPAEAPSSASVEAPEHLVDTAGPQDGEAALPVEAPQEGGPDAASADSAGSAAGAVPEQASAAEQQVDVRPHILVRSVSPQGRRRAGRAFGPEPLPVYIDELEEGQLELIQGDPLLVWSGAD